MKFSTFAIEGPKTANAFDLENAMRLKASLNSALKQKHMGLIVTALANKTFCSGGNIKSYDKYKTKAQGVLVNRKIRKIITDLRRVPILIVAAIEGDALGGGCELALSCDFIIASEKARFSFRQVTQNLTPGWGGAAPLLRRVRKSTALDWLTSGRWINSQEALQEGLIDRVAVNGDSVKLAGEFIKDRATPLIGEIKELIHVGGLGEERVFEKLWWSGAHQKAMKATLIR
jgi:enoyl-CoA hydratase/carnithine racemase